MSDETRWDQDPPSDELLARLLRAGGAAVPDGVVDWERLCRNVMRSATGKGVGESDWWEVVAQWGRVAMAASLAAMLLSGLLLWQAMAGPSEPAAIATPESIAVARAVSAYPDETAFASLVRTEHHDEFTAWGTR
jgi:hypothetical protein